jgi:hypothetical protein
MMRPSFLSAEWRHLVMLNYIVDPALLEPLVPHGVTLDTHDGHHYASVVGFLFQDTRIKGIPIPWHTDFEELNLRFYVRRNEPDPTRGLDHRRGVAFVKEVVPLPAIALVAQLLYNENYVSMPMRHHILSAEGQSRSDLKNLSRGNQVSFGFRTKDGQWGEVGATIAGPARPLEPGSHAQFIAEHYWGYARQKDGGTVEYEVTHPPWRVFDAHTPVLTGNIAALYGEPLARTLSGPPASVFVAEGSAVEVSDGVSLP